MSLNSAVAPSGAFGETEEFKRQQKLQEALQAILDKYNKPPDGEAETKPDFEFPDLELEKKEYDAPDDKELADRAKAEAEEYYQNSVDGIREKAEKESADLGQYREKTEQNAKRQEAAIAEDAQKAGQSAQDSALRRGLARSSIGALMQNDVESKALAAKQTLASESAAALEKIDYQIKAAETQRDAALQSFDIKYAAKLVMDLNELKKERDKKADAVKEYNNQIERQLAEYAMQKTKAEQDYKLKEYELSQKVGTPAGEEALKDEKYKQSYNLFLKHLSTLPKGEAQREIRDNPIYLKNLSGFYLNKLKNYFS